MISSVVSGPKRASAKRTVRAKASSATTTNSAATSTPLHRRRIAAKASSSAFSDIANGVIEIPFSIKDHFQLLNDIDDDQRAIYPEDIEGDTTTTTTVVVGITDENGNNAASSSTMDIDGGTVDDDEDDGLDEYEDPRNPPFQVRDHSSDFESRTDSWQSGGGSSAGGMYTRNNGRSGVQIPISDLLDETPAFDLGPPPPKFYGPRGVYQSANTNNNNNGYPLTSDLVCMYCERSFANIPIVFPSDKDGHTGDISWWGNWCTFGCLIRWVAESNMTNKGKIYTAIACLARDRFGITDPLELGIAPSKIGSSYKWGGPMSAEAAAASSKVCSSFVHTNTQFVPMPVILQINRFAANRMNAASEVARAVFDSDMAPTNVADPAELVSQLKPHIKVSTLDLGVYYDAEKMRWIDVHNDDPRSLAETASVLSSNNSIGSTLPKPTMYNPSSNSLATWNQTDPKDMLLAMQK